MKKVVSEEDRLMEKYTNSMISNGILPEQTETIKLFNRYNELRDLKASSIQCYSTYLKMFCKEVRKSFEAITKEDMENFLISIKDCPEKTKSNMKVVLKKFFQWFYKMENKEYPEIVKWIKTSVKNARRKMPEELLTLKEVLDLANVSDNLRDKALVLVLYESAMRVGELIDLKIKDVVSDNYGILLTISGKTGMRKVRLVNSVNSLVLWLNNHPEKNNPDAYVFVSFNRYRYGKKLIIRSIQKILRTLKERTEIKKHIHPHLFRHSRLSELTRKGYPESFLRQFAGWTAKSNMPEVYIHLSAKNIDDMMLEKEGLKELNKLEIVNVLKPITCPKCSEINQATNKFCSRCATPLDEKSMKEIEAENRIKRVIMSNPKIMEMLEASLKTQET